MNLLITGASGFLGSRVAAVAMARAHRVRVLVRRPESAPHGVGHGNVFTGDLAKPATLAPAVAGVDAVIHCAAATSAGRPDPDLSRRVNVAGTAALAAAAREASPAPPRWIQISSMSAHPGSTSVYGRTKLEADEAVRASGLPWTILRPSLIYGPGGRGLVAKTLALMRRLPVVPVVGPGRELLRPVHADDVARAALDCLAEPRTIGRTYMIGGPDEMEFNAVLRALARSRGLRRPLVHIPVPAAMLLARALTLLTPNPPITTDNVLGVKQAQRVEIEDAIRDFGFRPVPFEEGLRMCFSD